MTTITKNKLYKGRPDGSFEETINETIIDNNDDRVFELEKQLHEQYAVNNNSNAGALISLLSPFLVAVSGYGYVMYAYSASCAHCNLQMLYISAGIASLIMAMLYCISIHLGSSQRMEQFIILAIRLKYYNCIAEDSNKGAKEYTDIFPLGYHPFNKDESSFVQGLYNELSHFIIVVLYVIALTIIIVDDHICYSLMFICYTSILHSIIYNYKNNKYLKYKKREKECMKLFETITNIENKTDGNKSVSNVTITIHWSIIAIFALCAVLAFIYPYVKLFCDK